MELWEVDRQRGVGLLLSHTYGIRGRLLDLEDIILSDDQDDGCCVRECHKSLDLRDIKNEWIERYLTKRWDMNSSLGLVDFGFN